MPRQAKRNSPSRPLPSRAAGSDEEILLSEVVGPTPLSLPPLSMPEKPGCRVCGRKDRALWDGLCAWCGEV